MRSTSTGSTAGATATSPIGEDGHLLVTPTREPARAIDVFRVVEDLAKRGIKSPVLLRFPQLLEGQVNELAQSFANAIREYNYRERYHPVFPVKVNQQRSVVDGLVRVGLDARVSGSRREAGRSCSAAIALDLSPDALVICNGFKDQAYLQMASTACRLGKQVVRRHREAVRGRSDPRDGGARAGAVQDRLPDPPAGQGLRDVGEVRRLHVEVRPDDAPALARDSEKLTASGLRSQLALLHFHIGSQITEIRKLKTAVREAARIYAKVRKLGADVSYLDVGGGLGIDYDGSKTSSDASVNYSVQEYANDVVFGIQEVCDEEHVPPPRIVSESGRMLVAYHAMLITDVQGCGLRVRSPDPPALTGREAQVVQDLADAAKKISVKNYREFYHDAIEYRDQMYSLFNLGMLGLEERGKGEVFFREVAMKAVRYSKSAKFVADEFQELETKLHDKYICNFSVFQSVPDHWALDQLFPIIPVHRLNEHADAEGDARRHHLRFRRRGREVRRPEGHQGRPRGPRAEGRGAVLPRVRARGRVSGHDGRHAQPLRAGATRPRSSSDPRALGGRPTSGGRAAGETLACVRLRRRRPHRGGQGAAPRADEPRRDVRGGRRRSSSRTTPHRLSRSTPTSIDGACRGLRAGTWASRTRPRSTRGSSWGRASSSPRRRSPERSRRSRRRSDCGSAAPSVAACGAVVLRRVRRARARRTADSSFSTARRTARPIAFVGGWAAIFVTYPASIAAIALVFAEYLAKATGVSGWERTSGRRRLSSSAAILNVAGLRTGPRAQIVLTANEDPGARRAGGRRACRPRSHGPPAVASRPRPRFATAAARLALRADDHALRLRRLVGRHARRRRGEESRKEHRPGGAAGDAASSPSLYGLTQVAVMTALPGGRAAALASAGRGGRRGDAGPHRRPGRFGAGRREPRSDRSQGPCSRCRAWASRWRESGAFLPASATLHPRWGTPARATAALTAASVAYVFLASFRNIVALFTFSVWIFYGITAVGPLILRRRGVGEPVAWRAPLGRCRPSWCLGVGAAMTVQLRRGRSAAGAGRGGAARAPRFRPTRSSRDLAGDDDELGEVLERDHAAQRAFLDDEERGRRVALKVLEHGFEVGRGRDLDRSRAA